MKSKATDTAPVELSDEETSEIVKGYLYPGEPSDNEDENAEEKTECNPEDETDLPEEWDDDTWDQADPNDD